MTFAALETVQFLFAYLAIITAALAAFNMLSGFPMEGGRVLRAILGRNRPFAVATAQAAQVDKAFVVLVESFGLLAFDVFSIAITFSISIAATAEARQTALRAAIEGVTNEDVMTPIDDLDTVASDVTVTELLDEMLQRRHAGIPSSKTARSVGSLRSMPFAATLRGTDPHRRSAR